MGFGTGNKRYSWGEKSLMTRKICSLVDFRECLLMWQPWTRHIFCNTNEICEYVDLFDLWVVVHWIKRVHLKPDCPLNDVKADPYNIWSTTTKSEIICGVSVARSASLTKIKIMPPWTIYVYLKQDQGVWIF